MCTRLFYFTFSGLFLLSILCIFHSVSEYLSQVLRTEGTEEKKTYKNFVSLCSRAAPHAVQGGGCGDGGCRYLASIIVSSAAVPMSTLAHWRHRSSGPSPKVEQHVLPSSGKSDLTRFVCGCHFVVHGCFLWSAMVQDVVRQKRERERSLLRH